MSEDLHGCSPASEARGLYRMLGAGSTVEELRELIRVTPKTERTLRAFARKYAEDAHWIEATLKFRQAVLLEFERLVAEGVPIGEVPEADESESDAAEKTYAEAQP